MQPSHTFFIVDFQCGTQANDTKALGRIGAKKKNKCQNCDKTPHSRIGKKEKEEKSLRQGHLV